MRLFVGLAGGLVGGPVGGLVGGLVFIRSITLVLGARRWMLVGLFEFFGLFRRAGSSVWAAWMIAGGQACLEHFVLHLLLVRNGSVPWDYTKFLDHATDSILLRKVGGGYIFFH